MVINLGIIFKIFFLIILEISFSLSQNISSSFNLNSDIIFINQNNKNFYIEMYFINNESAVFYLNQIKINNILLNKTICNIQLNKVTCLISNNNLNESLSNDIYIKLNGQNKVIKIKKIYYTIEILENKTILNIFSKEKFLIKIKEKIIKSLNNNFAKYEISNKFLKDNEYKFINISIYNEKNNRKKIGEIYENFEDFHLRQLQDNKIVIKPNCFKYEENIAFNILFNEIIDIDNYVVNITKDDQIISSILNKGNNDSTLICNIMGIFDLGYYNVNIQNKKDNETFTLNFSVIEKEFQLKQNVIGHIWEKKENKISFDVINCNYSLNENTLKLDLEKLEEQPNILINDQAIYIEFSKNTKINFKETINIFYFNGKEKELIGIVFFYSYIINYSNELNLVNDTNFTILELIGTKNQSLIQSISLYNNDNTVNLTSNNFTIIEYDENEYSYNINVIFNLTNLKINKEVELFRFKIKYIDNVEIEGDLNNTITFPIFNCSEGSEPNKTKNQCDKCKEKQMNYSYITKSCVQNCNNDEYFFYDNNSCNKSCPGKYKFEERKTCYDNCENIEDEYLKNNNNEGKCENKSFILDLTTTQIYWEQTISVSFIFIDSTITNFLKNVNYNINIIIILQNYNSSAFDCNETENKIQCKFNLTEVHFADFNIWYNIVYKNKTFYSNFTNSTIKIKKSKYSCDLDYQNYESEKCQICKGEKKYYYNYSCHKECNSSDENYKYSFENNSIFRCISKDLCVNNYSKLISISSEINCRSKCEKKEGIYRNECINCSSLGEEYGLYYNGSCIICSDVGIEVYNGECKCKSGEGFDENYKCIKCNESEGKIEINRDCRCREGLINNNKTCELIENYFNGTKITCNTYNPCGINNQNGNCDDSLEIPFCKCNDNYIGLYCETENEELTNIINELNNSIISFINNNNYYNDIEFIQNNNLNIYVKKFSYLYLYLNDSSENEASEKIVNMTYNIINNFTLNNSINSNIRNIIDYIGFSYYYQKKFSSNKLRNLNNNINDNQIIKFYNKLFNETKFLNTTKTFSISSNRVFNYFLFTNTENITKEYIKECERNNIPYLSNTINNSVNYILHISKNKNASLNNILSHSYIIFYDENKTDITFKFKKEFKFNIELISLYENNLLLNYYLKKGINIYDSRDIVFREECYRTTKFNFDLISKFRNSLFQGEFYSENCQKNYIKNSNEYSVTFICDKLTNEFSYYLRNKSNYQINLVEYKSSYLSLHCLNDTQDIGKNIAFWLYMILIILIITFSILLFKTKKYKLEDLFDILKNDQLEIKTPNEYEEYEELRSNHKNKIEYYEFTTGNNGYFSIIKFNILHYHPLLIINKTSFLCPKWLNCLIFIFNISNLFGFNCLLYTNSYLEQRIYNKYRNNFTYPIKNEFSKLLFTILISLILTILIKGLNLISYSEARSISLSMIKNQKINKIFIEKNAYNKFYIRTLISLIIFIFTFYFWLYCIGFCYIFPKAQISWFYSGIWCMFLNWIVFSPFFLLILSIVEMFSVKFNYHYYFKRIFCF